MKIISNLLKDSHDELLAFCTEQLNNSNPMVDRIAEDDSVAGVVMTNTEGHPIFTTMTLYSATNHGITLNTFGKLTQLYIQEIDPLDKVLAIRIKTFNKEIMLTPDKDFNIIVVQHFRRKPILPTVTKSKLEKQK